MASSPGGTRMSGTPLPSGMRPRDCEFCNKNLDLLRGIAFRNHVFPAEQLFVIRTSLTTINCQDCENVKLRVHSMSSVYTFGRDENGLLSIFTGMQGVFHLLRFTAIFKDVYPNIDGTFPV